MPDDSPIIGPSETPRTLVEHAASDAMEAVKARLEIDGAHVEKMMVLIVAGKTGEVWDAVAAGEGIEDGGDLFAMLISEAIGVGRQLGLKVIVAPLGQG
jgi:hypothetical protein